MVSPISKNVVVASGAQATVWSIVSMSWDYVLNRTAIEYQGYTDVSHLNSGAPALESRHIRASGIVASLTDAQAAILLADADFA